MECYKFSSYVTISEVSPPPIDMSLVYDHLKVDNPPSAEEIAYIDVLVLSAIKYAELYMKRDIIQRTYKAFSDTLYWDRGYEVRRTPIISFTSLEYLKSDVLTTIDSADYFQTQSPNFIEIYPKDTWPTDIDCRAQAVELQFDAGYASSDDVPAIYLTAIYQHVANMYQNRGDCTKSSCAKLLPLTSKAIYEMNRIIDIKVC